MSAFRQLSVLSVASLLWLGSTTLCDNQPAPQEKYLGQPLPGTTPELFAPGLISRDDYFEHSGAVFSPDYTEVIWSGKATGERYFSMYHIRRVDGEWTAMEKVPFLDTNFSEVGPMYSPDGKLYFGLRCDIWVVERTDTGWSAAERISAVSSPDSCNRMCGATDSGSLYFMRFTYPSGSRSLYVAKKQNDTYAAPEMVDLDLEGDALMAVSAFVAPDESYIIVERMLDRRTSRFFVSFRDNAGVWSEPQVLPLIFGRFPVVSPDGEYLFYFTRDGIYWVSTEIIEQFRPGQ